MRNLYLLLVLSLVSLSARADFQSIRAAENAIRAYSDLATEAQNAADLAYPRGFFHSHGSIELRNVEALDAVSDLSNYISRELHQRVLRLLRAKTPEFKVDKQLDRLKTYQLQLSQAVNNLGIASTLYIQQLNQSASQSWRTLDKSLSENFGHNPNPHHNIKATCQGKSGGNFLVPKSHVECTFYGRGAKGYQVSFTNNGAVARVQSSLDPRQNTQSFSSDKVQVGWFPQYTVFAVGFNGQLKVVAQGTCQR